MEVKEKNTETNKEDLPDYKDVETCYNMLVFLIDKLTPKYTNHYEIIIEQESFIM